MTVVEQHRQRAGSRLALWTWVAVALVPVGLVLGVAVAFMTDGRDGLLMGAAPAVVSLAAPVAAVGLASRAVRAGHRSGKAAVVMSGLLLLATLVALPTLVYSVEGFLVVVSVLGVAALVVALAIAVVESRRRHRMS